MVGRAAGYRAELRELKDWELYLKKHSGLPGPRANLELVQAVGDEADADRLWHLSASSDEFLALCGTAGLGRIALMEPATVMTWLKELASDPRWRVREGVAIALQRIGRESMPQLVTEMQGWLGDGPYTQRADHLSCYGYKRPTSPNLDKLAANGAVFTECFSPHIPRTRATRRCSRARTRTRTTSPGSPASSRSGTSRTHRGSSVRARRPKRCI